MKDILMCPKCGHPPSAHTPNDTAEVSYRGCSIVRAWGQTDKRCFCDMTREEQPDIIMAT